MSLLYHHCHGMYCLNPNSNQYSTQDISNFSTWTAQRSDIPQGILVVMADLRRMINLAHCDNGTYVPRPLVKKLLLLGGIFCLIGVYDSVKVAR